MAYARFGDDSDVYVLLNIHGYLDCCRCSLRAEGADYPRFRTTDALVAHLREHVAAGDRVPPDTFTDLAADQAENDAWLA